MNKIRLGLNNRHLQGFTILTICFFLIVYVIIRANNLSLTYDEIITYEIQKTFTLSDAGKTANTHLLNTYLISASCYFFGVSELTVRLPNVLALLIYLFAAVKIAFFFKSNIRLHLFILLTVMPFLVDFFSLARGYGLGVSLMLLSVYCFFRFTDNNKTFNAVISLIVAMLAVLANYTILNYFLPLTAVLILIVLLNKSSIKSKGLNILLLSLMSTAFLIIITPTLFELKNGGQLFFGGRTNIYFDTISSLGKCFGYHTSYSFLAQGMFVLCFLSSIIIALVFCIRFIKKRATTPIGFLSIVFLVSLNIAVLQNNILDTNFPVERTALLYYPLMILVLFCGLNRLFEKKIKIFNTTIVVLFSFHFLFTLNLSHCYSWRYDSGTKSMMLDLKADGMDKINLGIAVINSPSVNFYKNNMKLDSLKVEVISDFWEYPFGIEEYNPYYYNAHRDCNNQMFFDIKKIIRPGIDYYYLDKFFIDELRKRNVKTKTIKEYPYSRTTLIKIY